jgi:hypothetical protein
VHRIYPVSVPMARLRFAAAMLAALVGLSSSSAQAAHAQDAECTYDDPDAPCALADGSVVSGYIRQQSGRSYFWFGVPERGTRAQIEITDLPADYDLYLFNSTDPDPTASSINEGTTPELIDIMLQDPGVYFVYVVSDPSRPFNADEPYTLTLKLVFPEPTPQVVATPTTPAPTPPDVNLMSVPPLVGRTGDASAGAVRDAGLVPTLLLADRFSERGTGTVAAQEPPAGTPVQPGSEVIIYVATGNVQIPSVLNRPEQEAEAILHEAGLQTNTVRRTSETIPPGVAIDTDPMSGTVVPSGTKVRVFISRGR